MLHMKQRKGKAKLSPHRGQAAVLQDGLRDKCSLAEHEIKQITAALDANNDGEVRLVTQTFGLVPFGSQLCCRWQPVQ